VVETVGTGVVILLVGTVTTTVDGAQVGTYVLGIITIEGYPGTVTIFVDGILVGKYDVGI